MSGGSDCTVRLWDLETGAEIRRLEGHEGWVRAVAVTADGGRAVSGGEDGTVRLWDLETGAEIRRLEGHEDWVMAVAVTADGGRAVSSGEDSTVRLWNLETGAEISAFYADALIACCTLTSDNHGIVVADKRGLVDMLRIAE